MRALWLSAAAAVVLEAVVLWLLAPLQPGALVLQLAWTPRGFGEIIHLWSAEDLARYRAHLIVDCALLLAYGSFGWLLATRTRLLAPLPPRVQALAPFLPLFAAGFDVLENSLHWWLTAAPRFGMPWLYLASASAAALKWLLLMLFVALLLWALAVDRGDGQA